MNELLEKAKAGKITAAGNLSKKCLEAKDNCFCNKSVGQGSSFAVASKTSVAGGCLQTHMTE